MLSTRRGTAGWAAVPAVIFAIAAAAPACAHVHWQQVNGVTGDTVALYHLDNMTDGSTPAADGLAPGLGLSVSSGAAAMAATDSTPGTIFGDGALLLPATQTLRSTDTVTQLGGDLTIECWFKWLPGVTSATLELGLQSGARLLIARDTQFPGNDRFGVAGTHGSYVSAPGFQNWPAVGDEEAGLDEWRHLALTIHSTGMHFDAVSGHDVFSTGTTGRIFLNGHETGFGQTLNLAGLQVHDASRITVVMRGGEMAIDEFTVWRRDWSADGTAANPFGNGRGGSRVSEWRVYDE